MGLKRKETTITIVKTIQIYRCQRSISGPIDPFRKSLLLCGVHPFPINQLTKFSLFGEHTADKESKVPWARDCPSELRHSTALPYRRISKGVIRWCLSVNIKSTYFFFCW